MRAEPRDFALLCIERHDQLHPLQRLNQKRADAGTPVAHVGDRTFEPATITHQRPERHRQQHKTHGKQHRIEVEQNRDGSHEEQHVPDPRQRHLGHHPLNLADVAVDARRDLPQWRARIETW